MKISSLSFILAALFLLYGLLLPDKSYAQTGSLQVIIEPQEAREAGAQWRRAGETEWRESGFVEDDISVGEHIIQFKAVAGWNDPEHETVSVEEDKIEYLTKTYSKIQQATGTLRVVLEPQEVLDLGAQWRRVGGQWFDSGYSEFNVTVGEHQVEFAALSGWISPQRQLVVISENQITNVSYSYVQSIEDGALKVNIEPAAARDAGAQWRRFGTSDWFGPGDTEVGIPEGEHLIEFSVLTGWAKPPTQAVSIAGGEITVLNVSYLQGGTLHVFIEPVEARQAGAGWRLAGVIPDNDEGWYTDDLTTLDGLRPGRHLIEFNSIPGWIRPPEISVTVSAGRTTYQSGRYVLSTETGSFSVFIEPAPASSLGARWRRVGTDIWLESGEMERGFPEGTYTIEFKPIPGWAPPGNRAITVHRGNPPVNLTGYYHSPRPGVRVMNWLESVFPGILDVSGRQVQDAYGWYIRYYPETDTYLGVWGEHLYYYAPSVENVVHDLGKVESLVPSARGAGF